MTSQPLPVSWLDQDVGSVGVTGSASFANGTFTVAGAGQGTMITASDGFHFGYQPLAGDGTIVARVVSVQGSSAAQIGIMVRETLSAGANHVYVFDYSSSILMTERTSTGASSTYQSVGSGTPPNWMKLVRSGNVFSMYGSADGVNWVALGTSQTVSMAENVYVGLAVSNRTTSSLATATFDNVSLTTPGPPAPSFSLLTSPSSVTVTQGGSGANTITVTPQNGFNGSVNLSASGLPSGVTALFSPSSTTSTSTLTLTASNTAPPGTSTVTVAGSSGSLTSTATLSLNVNPQGTYTLSASPNSLTIPQGASGASTITVTPQNGFNGSVNLSASGLPSGVTASFNPSTTTSTSTLTLTANSSAATGTVAVTVTGSSAGFVGATTTTVNLTVTAVLHPLPTVWSDGDIGSVGVAGSASFANGTFTVAGAGQGTMITASDGFHFVYQPLAGDGTIVARVVSVQGSSAAQIGIMVRETLSAGANHVYVFDYSSSILMTERTSTGASSTYQSVGSGTPPNWMKLVRSGNVFSMYGSADGVNWVALGTSQTVSMAENVYVGLAVSNRTTSSPATATFDNVSLTTPGPPAPSFSLLTSPSSVTVTQGGSGASTITVTPRNGFNGSVNLSASGLPSGVTALFSPSSTTSTSTLTLTASNTAPPGTSTVTVAGSSGSFTSTATLSLNVNPQGTYTLSASPNSLTIPQGASGASTITVTPQNGFNGSVNLSASGLPSGVTASFNPSTTTSTSTLTLTANSSAATGTVAVTVTGSSAGFVGATTTTVNLTVTAVLHALPTVWSDGDIGSVGVAGSASFANGTFTVAGAGQGTMITASDGFHFVYQPLAGDGTIVARVVSVQGSSAAQIGIMVRETLSAGANHVYVFDYSSSILMTERTSTGASSTYQSVGSGTPPNWMKLVRSGNVFSMYGSADGVNWVALGTSQTVSMAENVYVGLAVSNRTTSSLATATFDSVSVSSGAAPAPVITSVSATTGTIGSQVVISGSGFGATQAGSAGLLNGAAVTINTWSGTAITITIPSGATSGPLLVSVAPSMNDSNVVRFTMTSQPLPVSWLDQDVGSVGVAGSASFANGTFTVAGAGQGTMITASDGFHFVYQPLAGDGTIVARVGSVQRSSAAQIGIMVRETLSAGANHVYVFDYSSSILMTERTSTGASSTYQSVGSGTPPNWMKLERSGNVF